MGTGMGTEGEDDSAGGAYNNNNNNSNSNSRKKDPTKDGEDDNEWVCKVCRMLEAEDGSALCLCDGPCHSSVHVSCMKLDLPTGSALPSTQGDVWLCDDCRIGKHECFICRYVCMYVCM